MTETENIDTMALYKSTGNATLDAVAVISGGASPELVLEWEILLGLVLVVTGVRTYARAKVNGLEGLRWDDYLVWIGVVLYAALTVNGRQSLKPLRAGNLLTCLLVYIIGVEAEGIANDGLSDVQRAALASDPDGQEFRLRRFGSMAQVAKLFIYALVLWTLKASLLYNFAIRLTVGSSLIFRLYRKLHRESMSEADARSNRAMCLARGRELGSVLGYSWRHF